MENLLPVIGKGVAVFAREVGQTEYDRHCYHIGKFFSTSVSTNLLKRRWKCGSICSTIRTAMRESWEAYKMPQAEVMKKKNCLEFIG